MHSSPEHQERPVGADPETPGQAGSSSLAGHEIGGGSEERNPGPWCRGRTVAVMGACLALAGCDRPATLAPGSAALPGPGTVTAGGGDRAKQAAFLNEIRKADPNFQSIERALLNEQNELGLILDPSVELAKVPALMKLMLTKMAAQFPGEDLTVVAYAPCTPPRKVGTAQLNARTPDMTNPPE
ncbi:MAG: hypothetical protein V4675_09275 [Verrucomicrobiota bacterium]